MSFISDNITVFMCNEIAEKNAFNKKTESEVKTISLEVEKSVNTIVYNF